MKVSSVITILIPLSLSIGQGRVESGADTVLHVKNIEEVSYRSAQFEIAGDLYLPATGQAPYPLVIWVSGSGPGYRTIRNVEAAKLVNCFLEAGFAYFMIDKPGWGKSSGRLASDSIFVQLSGIVIDAAKTLRRHPLIDSSTIGLFGSSQAGYIMPMAASKSPDIRFMMGFSCPGENSVEQWNYLLEQQLLCEGRSVQRARIDVEMFSLLRSSPTKEEFDRALGYFQQNPLLVKSVGYDSGFTADARSWWPRRAQAYDEMLFDPMVLVGQMAIPVYMVYGGYDTQIDPEQAMEAYRRAGERAGIHVRIARLPNCDHNMKLSRGCLNEIADLNKRGVYKYDPEFLGLVRQWCKEVLRGKS